MTPDKIDALKPGPELDKDVADALEAQDILLGDIGARCFSTDWNDAMWAAEKIHLFSGKRREPEPHKPGYESIGYNFPYLMQHNNGYVVMQWEWHSSIPYGIGHQSKEHGGSIRISDGKTGPETICKAILKLHNVH